MIRTHETDWGALHARLRKARAALGITWETLRKLAPRLNPTEVFGLAIFEQSGQPHHLDYWTVYDLVRSLETLAGKRLETAQFSAPPQCRYDACLSAWRRGALGEAQAILSQLE